MSEFEIKPASEIPNAPKPIVRRKTYNGRRYNYPFGKMKVGEAFVVPADHPGAAISLNHRSPKAICSAGDYGRRNGIKFVCDTQVDGSVRIERIA